MTILRLRSLSRADIAWRQVLANWRNRGIAAVLADPADDAGMMAITADNGAWQGVIDGRTWLASHLPQLAALACAARNSDDIIALFNSMEHPLTFEHDALAYRRLHARALQASAQRQTVPVPYLSARECGVWVTHLADLKQPTRSPVGPRLKHTPVLVELAIGASHLANHIVTKLAIGDVMLITRITQQILCQGRVVGKFWQNEEMIMMEEHYEDYDLTETFGSPAFGNEHASPESLSGTLAAVPVKLDFILQSRYLDIGELQELFAGKVLEMDPAAEKKVEIRANGIILARGELVQLEDRLGVEVMELYQESDDAN